MPGQRPPGSWGLEPRAEAIDQGTSCLISTPSPLPVGFDANTRPNSQSAIGLASGTAFESVERLQKAVSDFHRSETWSSLQPIAFRLLGQYSFGLGVVYGIGENVVTSVVELLLLVKMLLLADLYDRAQQPVFSAASLNPVGLLQRMLAEVSMRTFSAQLTEAHRERVELIEELRYAMTHIGEVLGNIKEGYVAKWDRFEALVQERTFSSQFHAGRIFGEVLIEVVTIIGGGTAAVRAASKIPKLAKLARLKIPPRSTAYSGRPGGRAPVTETPATPSQLRPAPVIDDVPKKPQSAGGSTEVAGSIRNVNPLGSGTNCVNCAIATDATLAGHPASALASGPASIRVLEAAYGRQFVHVSSQSAIEAQLSSAGPGARGIVFGSRGPGQVGHVFNAVNQRGVVRFLDGQTGTAASFQGFTDLYFLPTWP
jgi:hypothetical protein